MMISEVLISGVQHVAPIIGIGVTVRRHTCDNVYVYIYIYIYVDVYIIYIYIRNHCAKKLVGALRKLTSFIYVRIHLTQTPNLEILSLKIDRTARLS